MQVVTRASSEPKKATPPQCRLQKKIEFKKQICGYALGQILSYMELAD
jgi:hypothetical protein